MTPHAKIALALLPHLANAHAFEISHFNFADPFAEETTTKVKKGADTKEYVHVRVQQRNGKKSLTTVQGLPEAFDYKKILKALKKGTS